MNFRRDAAAFFKRRLQTGEDFNVVSERGPSSLSCTSGAPLRWGIQRDDFVFQPAVFLRLERFLWLARASLSWSSRLMLCFSATFSAVSPLLISE